MTLYCQIICSCLLSCLWFNMGIMYAWPSSTVFIFTANETTLNRPMSPTELSLFGSLQSVGALVGTAVAGCYLDKLGRKKCTILSALTCVIAWTLIAASERVEVILTAVFIGGLGNAVFVLVVIYISEICQDCIRGTMTACPILFNSTGLLTSYLLGGTLTYKAMVYANLSIAVVIVILLTALKETPTFLMKTGYEDEAAKSVAFYRRTNKDSKEVLEEISKIRRQIYPNIEEIAHLRKDETKIYSKEHEIRPLVGSFFNKLSSTRSQLTLCLVLVSAYILQGFPVIQVYLEPMFQEAVPADVLSANACCVLAAGVAVAAGILSAYLTDAAGRRPLMIVASAVTGVLCVLIGTQIHLEWGPSWLSAVLIYLYIVSFTMGAGTIPFVINGDVFLPDVKCIMSTIVLEWSWIANFMMLYVFPPALSALGVAPIFYFFAAMSFATSIFCVFFLPETRRLPIDVIQKLFNKY